MPPIDTTGDNPDSYLVMSLALLLMSVLYTLASMGYIELAEIPLFLMIKGREGVTSPSLA